MRRACPKCRTIALEPGTAAPDPDPAKGGTLSCPACRGIWVPHSIIERWSRASLVDIGAAEPPALIPEGDHRTGLCPEGHGILIRARFDEEPPFHLERCPACRGVWLDAGEWQRLAAHQFLGHLDDLWDPAWQRQQRAEHSRRKLDEALAAVIGAALFADLARVVDQLREHPARAQALAWISTHLED